MTSEDEDGGVELDEFDLDLAWGELQAYGGGDLPLELYLPTGRDIPGETCDTHNPTCPDTCHPTCPDTCRATCAATCRAICPDTCRATCQDTCGRTCDCVTEAQTHCFTCRSGCERP